ncbi:MAG: histone-lysine N-methyltransferase [Elusimicrobia bacterium]|jgi:isopropylmalate/homocitrate/citramalate synthase|nr:histone-lysine N-methyltransferase [Elusimicrobiota bacterium]
MSKKTPNLFRGTFTYKDVPYIDFDKEAPLLNIPENIWITDTTFRDGQQARAPYTVKQVVDLFTLLHRLGGPQGIIRSSEFFLYSHRDREAVRRCMDKGYKYPEITGWIRANEKDFKLVKDMGLKETGILTSASDYHIYLKLNIDRKTAMDNYLRIVDTALENNIIPRCHLEDITRADFEGFVIPFVKKLMERSADAGMPVKIRACDTLGYGVPHPQATLPRSVPKIFDTLVNKCGVPSEYLEWHGHNDFHKVIVNGLNAWMYGAAGVNGTLLGYGERTGNSPIEGLVMDYISLKKRHDGMDTKVITEIGDYYRKELDEQIPPSFPFVGSEFNTTRAGIHADGLIKNEEIYNIFDTDKLLNRPMNVAITDKSGVAGISMWINNFLNLSDEKKIDKKDPRLMKIYKIVMERYRRGRTTALSNEEMENLTKEYLPEFFESEFDRLEKKADRLATQLVEDISNSDRMRSMDIDKQEEVMEEVREKHNFIQFMYVVDRKGVKITRNIIDPAFSKEFEKKDVGVIYSDREWFNQPIKTGMSFISEFYVSRMTERLCITVSAPLRDDNDKIIGVVGMDMSFSNLVKI